MIVLDTNVISEVMKPRSDAAVADWLDRQSAGTLYLAATTLCELLAGIAIVPVGRRREAMRETLDAILGTYFDHRVLPFDRAGAESYAGVVERARANGYRIAIADGQIAAVAEVNGFGVATRDTGPFLAAGVPTINPWTD